MGALYCLQFLYNYKPISVQQVLSKILEKHVHDSLMEYLKNLYALGGNRAGDLSINRRKLYHVAIKASLYRKEVHVYGIPQPVTCDIQRKKTFFS